MKFSNVLSFVALSLIAIPFVAHADPSPAAHPTPTSINGAWSYETSAGGFDLSVIFDFEPPTLYITGKCSLSGDWMTPPVTTELNVPIRVEGNQFRVLRDGYASNSANGINCPMTAHARVANYSIQGNQLVLSGAGEPTVIFTRVGSDSQPQ